MNHFIQTNGIKLHYLEFKGDRPAIVLMHGLTANAHAFDGLIAAGLSPLFNVIAVDLRGRGESDHPGDDYSMAAHAKDIVGLLDALQIQQVVIGGHSFGGLLTYFLAAHYPERVKKMVLMDAAARMHPNTKEMLGPTLSRLGQQFQSFNAYIDKVKAAPYITAWDEHMLSYYRANVKENNDGTVTPVPQPQLMQAAVNGALAEPWLDYISGVDKPAILINGGENYTMNAPLLPQENALETVAMMRNCKYVKVPGNHQTMLYGRGATAIVEAISSFLNKE